MARDFLLDGERSQRGPPRMIFVRDRRSEQCHEAIAKKLIDRSLVAVHLGHGHAKNASRNVCMPSGPSRSASPVDPTRSQNNTVTCFRSPSIEIGTSLLVRSVPSRRRGHPIHMPRTWRGWWSRDVP